MIKLPNGHNLIRMQKDYMTLYFRYNAIGGDYERKVLSLTPHQLYSYTEKDFVSYVRGIGKKKAVEIIEARDKRRKEFPHYFCECGEPILLWAKYCPTCGKKLMDEVKE